MIPNYTIAGIRKRFLKLNEDAEYLARDIEALKEFYKGEKFSLGFDCLTFAGLACENLINGGFNAINRWCGATVLLKKD